MDDDMAQGEVKVWRGFTLGSLGSIFATLFVSAVGLSGAVWGAGTVYHGFTGRLDAVEKAAKETSDAVKQESVMRRQEHRDTINLLCAIEKTVPAALCQAMQRGDAAQPDQPPG